MQRQIRPGAACGRFVLALLVTIGATGAARAAEEHLKFALDDSWRLANQQVDPVRQVRLMEFVRTSESIDTWTELVTM